MHTFSYRLFFTTTSCIIRKSEVVVKELAPTVQLNLNFTHACACTFNTRKT